MKQYSQIKESGIDWIGDSPSHGELKRLKFIAKQVNGKSCEKPGETPYVGLENVKPGVGKLVDLENNQVDGLFKSFEPGNVLFGKLRPYLSKAFLADFSGRCSTEFLV